MGGVAGHVGRLAVATRPRVEANGRSDGHRTRRPPLASRAGFYVAIRRVSIDEDQEFRLSLDGGSSNPGSAGRRHGGEHFQAMERRRAKDLEDECDLLLGLPLHADGQARRAKVLGARADSPTKSGAAEGRGPAR